jgi:creatinine amidohydrolase
MAHAWRWWLDMTTEDFRGLDPAETVALLPVAAVEQHGPHLPVSVDATLNRGIVAAATAHFVPDLKVLILPQTDIGKSNEHLAFPGTLSFSAETLIRIWTEIGECVHRAGIRKFVLFNSHGGQPQIMDIVARDLRVRLKMAAVAASWWAYGMPEGLWPAPEMKFGIHAGGVETSMMMHLAPHTVRGDKIANFKPGQIDLAEHFKLLTYTGSSALAWQSQDLHPSGAVGDATDADAARGAKVVDHAARKLAALLAEVARFPLDRIKDYA